MQEFTLEELIIIEQQFKLRYCTDLDILKLYDKIKALIKAKMEVNKGSKIEG